MASKPHKWQKIRAGIILVGIVVAVIAAFIALALVAYRFGWIWTGFIDYITPPVPVKPQYQPQQYQRGKTLWDWLQLFIVPIILAIGGFWFSQIQKHNEQKAIEQREKTDREAVSENQREAALQTYFDRMSELLLKEQLSKSKRDDEIQIIARTRTLTVLNGLDSTRKKSLLRFLQESGLIRRNADISVLNMEGADLGGAELDQIDLKNADLHGTNLSKSNLKHAKLSNINLSTADLRGANLYDVNLYGANLSGAHLDRVDLRGANLLGAILNEANLRDSYLSGANLSKADLSLADLRGANLSDKSRGDANLRKKYMRLDALRRVKPTYRIWWFLFYFTPTRIRLFLPFEQAANLSGADLRGANLSQAYLGQVDLSDANLQGAILIEANLRHSYLSDADLSGANLSNANLSKSHVTDKQLAKAKSLKGTIMPDGSKHP